MPKTEFIYLKGKTKWARVVQPDLKYNCWSMVFYPDSPSYTKLLELKESKGETQGILNKIKKDDDGYFVTLKRPVSKLYRTEHGSVEKGLSPPVILNADGTSSSDGLRIGNGSDVTVKIEYYKYKSPHGTGYGTAVRLNSVRIDNLVPFEKERDFTQEEEKLARGLAEQPAQEW